MYTARYPQQSTTTDNIVSQRIKQFSAVTNNNTDCHLLTTCRRASVQIQSTIAALQHHCSSNNNSKSLYSHNYCIIIVIVVSVAQHLPITQKRMHSERFGKCLQAWKERERPNMVSVDAIEQNNEQEAVKSSAKNVPNSPITETATVTVTECCETNVVNEQTVVAAPTVSVAKESTCEADSAYGSLTEIPYVLATINASQEEEDYEEEKDNEIKVEEEKEEEENEVEVEHAEIKEEQLEEEEHNEIKVKVEQVEQVEDEDEDEKFDSVSEYAISEYDELEGLMLERRYKAKLFIEQEEQEREEEEEGFILDDFDCIEELTRLEEVAEEKKQEEKVKKQKPTVFKRICKFPLIIHAIHDVIIISWILWKDY